MKGGPGPPKKSEAFFGMGGTSHFGLFLGRPQFGISTGSLESKSPISPHSRWIGLLLVIFISSWTTSGALHRLARANSAQHVAFYRLVERSLDGLHSTLRLCPAQTGLRLPIVPEITNVVS
jgi:hypothetical protein